MRKPPYGAVEVYGAATDDDGLRMDHPRLMAGIDTLIKKGYGNERICHIIGVPGSVVDTRRSRMKKQLR